MNQITFGTSGWRGRLADDFTCENVRIVAQAIADYIEEAHGKRGSIIAGYDCRFHGDEFAREVARVMAGNGIRVLMSDNPVPTPAVSYGVLHRKTEGAVNVTASHNPYDFNGIKYSPEWGGPALPETTRWIEKRANELLALGTYQTMKEEEAKTAGLWEGVNLSDDYLAALCDIVDFDVLRERGGIIAYDPMHCVGSGYLDRILSEQGITIEVIHTTRDPYFGGGAPDPSQERLHELSGIVSKERDMYVGLATDGDADRFGIVDFDGAFIEPNYIIALLVDYLIGDRGFSGGAARTVATSHLVDAVCRHYDVPCYETPVGFKYIGQYLAEGKIAAGGEESAGFSLSGHVPEKDGIISCLLVCEMMAKKKKTIKELISDLYRRVGSYRTRRVNVTLTEDLEAVFSTKMEAPPKAFSGISVVDLITIDGQKFMLEDGSWVLFRKSGTEPVVRIYAEADDDKKLSKIIASAESFIVT
jgi:alpha-D-glucose phosphate-specific phosphoglucomutase